MDVKKKDLHQEGPQIECEKCDGEIEILNETFPRAYECKCKKCGHRFFWTQPEKEDFI